jgi:hypothetical protein
MRAFPEGILFHSAGMEIFGSEVPRPSFAASPATPFAQERRFIGLLCVVAALHAMVFIAAFPFFNNLDEAEHFDLAFKYSRGQVPRSFEMSADTVVMLRAVFGAPFYVEPPSNSFAEDSLTPLWKLPPVPLWKLPPEKIVPYLPGRLQANLRVNFESSQQPLYYLLAGAWWRLGEWLHIRDLPLLYWVRLINVPLVIVLTWLGGLAARRIFPENGFIRLAVPLLIAFMPLSVFYGIDNDALVPVTFSLAFISLLKFFEMETPSTKIAVVTGVTLAMAYLSKVTILPLLVVAAGFLAFKMFDLSRHGKLQGAVPALAALFFSSTLPMAASMAWCQIHFGDLLGSGQKTQMLTWTSKPVGEWLSHPLFTPSGCWFFLEGNLSTFWQGEYVFHRLRMTLPAASDIYTLLTLSVLFLVSGYLFFRSGTFSIRQRQILWFSLGLFAAALAFPALLSVKYDFHECSYPSREHPFFVSGRLMAGALLPFMLAFAAGLDCLLGRFTTRNKFLLLGVFLVAMLMTEIYADRAAFADAYNFYHN